jgi:oligopeptide transport system substrate-binding protein
MRTKFGWRLLALLAVLAFVVVACTDDGGETTTTAASTTSEATTTTGAGTTTTGGGETTTTTAPPAGGFTYRTGMFQDITTDNYWAYLDPQSTVYNAFVLGNTKPALFVTDLPGLELDYGVAASADPGVATADGDGFSVTVAMREDAVWSDGSPITAHDIVFTAETVRDFALGGNWVSAYQWAPVDEETGEVSMDILGLTAVEALDDYTVKFTWNLQPGLAVWPYAVGTATFMSKGAWDGVRQLGARRVRSDRAQPQLLRPGAGVHLGRSVLHRRPVPHRSDLFDLR